MTSRPPIRGCLLDVDGTLIDSNDAHARSWVDVLQENDFDVTYAQVRALLEQAGLSELIRRRTTSDDAENSKPDPDIVHAALRRGKLDPETTVMVGDTPYDVEAADRAGVRSIALRCGGWWADDALGGAIAIYTDPAELLGEYAQSPLGVR